MAGNPNYETALLSSTLEKFTVKQPVDTFFEKLSLWEWLNAKGGIKKRVDGGLKMVVPLMYAGNSTVMRYAGYDTLDVSPQEGFTAAEYEYKGYNGAISISGEEELKNAGEAQMFDLLDAKWTQLRMSFRDLLNADAYLDGTQGTGQEAGKGITGLALMVDSAGTYGNIARNTNAWWSAQETAVGGPLQIHGASGMTRMYNDCSLGRGAMVPDGIMTTQEVFEAYEAVMAPYLRWSVTGEANAVFESDNLKFRKATMMWDRECQSGVMYFLNSQVMELRVRKDMTTTPFQTPINQDAKVAHIRFWAQLVAKNCRHLGKFTGIS